MSVSNEVTSNQGSVSLITSYFFFFEEHEDEGNAMSTTKRAEMSFVHFLVFMSLFYTKPMNKRVKIQVTFMSSN